MDSVKTQPLRPTASAAPLGLEPGERRSLRSRMLRLFPRAGWPSYIATALLGVAFAAVLGALAPLFGLNETANIPSRPAYLMVAIFIAPAIETAIFLSLPAFLIAILSRDIHFKYLCLFLIVPLFAISHLPQGPLMALTALGLGAAFAGVYIQAERLSLARQGRHSPFLAAAATHGLYNLFTALLHFSLPLAA